MHSTFVKSILVMGLFASVATAGLSPNIGDKMYFNNYVGGQLGGPVTAMPVAPSNFTPFNTFCIELGETIYVNGGAGYAYVISGIGTSNTSGRSMSGKTAWLYTNYLGGTLASFNDTQAHRNALQYGIWRSMGYTDAELIASEGATGINAALATYNSLGWDTLYANSGWGNSIGNVRVANLLFATAQGNFPVGARAQDVLITVPAPAAAGLCFMGLGLVGWIRRRLA